MSEALSRLSWPTGASRTTNRLLIIYGCPRSGTTYWRKLAQEALTPLGITVIKLSEAAWLHPCKSSSGLAELSNALNTKWTRLTILRTLRHPLEICESFHHLRKHPNAGGHARRTDGEIIRAIRAESRNTWRQLGELSCGIVTARYESLSQPNMQAALAMSLAGCVWMDEKNQRGGAYAIKGMLRMTFGSRDYTGSYGRLADGCQEIMAPQKRQWFARKLKAVIEREGYGTEHMDG